MSAPHRSPRSILVTGGVRGLGLACARHFAALGDHVHLAHRGVDPTQRPLDAQLPGPLHLADLARPEEAARLVAEVLEQEGRLDHCVHAVGDYAAGPLAEMPLGEIQRLHESNVSTALNLIEAARPHLRATRGSFVGFGLAGIEGLRARRTCAAYAAAKTALLVLVRSLALEEAAHGVRFNLVSPGVVPHADAHAETHALERSAAIPAGRAGTPQEVAAAVAFLCSRDAEYTTGSNLLVAGGWML